MTRPRLWWVPLLLLVGPLFGLMPLHRDLGDYFLPMRGFSSALLRSGAAPWLNPLNGCGEPWFANPQTHVLSPLAHLLSHVPVEWALTAEIALHLAWLSLGMGAVARAWGAGPRGVALSELVAWGSGPVLSMVGVLNNLDTLAWLPWMSLFAARRSLRGVGLTAFATAMAWLGGEPQLWAIGVLLAAGAGRVRARAVAGLLLGAAICAIQMIPFAFWVIGGDRGSDALAWALPGALVPRDLLGLLAPLTLSGSGGIVYLESLWIGVPVICLAVLGMRRRVALGWLTIALFGLGMLPAIGLAEVYSFMTRGLVRFPSRFAVVAVALMIPLVGVGLRPWLAGRGRLLAFALGSLGLLGASLCLDPLGRALTALASGLTVITALPSSGRRLRWAALMVGLLPLVAVMPGLLDLQPVSSLSVQGVDWPEAGSDGGRLYSSPVIRSDLTALATQPRLRRQRFIGYLNLDRGIVSVRSPAPVVNRQLAQHLDRVDAGPQGRWWLDSLAVRWVVLPRSAPPPASMEATTSTNALTLYRNRAAGDLVRLVSSASHDASSAELPGGLVTMRARASRLDVRTISQDATWLRIALPPEPGWQWSLGGRRVDLEPLGGALQILRLAPGEQELSGVYRPPGLLVGGLTSLSASVVAVGLVCLGGLPPRWRNSGTLV